MTIILLIHITLASQIMALFSYPRVRVLGPDSPGPDRGREIGAAYLGTPWALDIGSGIKPHSRFFLGEWVGVLRMVIAPTLVQVQHHSAARPVNVLGPI